MRRPNNIATADKLANSMLAQNKEIAELEKKLKNFNTNIYLDSLPENREFVDDMCHYLKEEKETFDVSVAQALLGNITKRLAKLEDGHKASVNSVLVMENQIVNMIVFKMDLEEVKYLIYKRMLLCSKNEIIQEAVEHYSTVKNSLEDLLKFVKNKEPSSCLTAVPASRIINSTFYQAKLGAKISYEACFAKLASLARKMKEKVGLEQEVQSEFDKYTIIAGRTA